MDSIKKHHVLYGAGAIVLAFFLLFFASRDVSRTLRTPESARAASVTSAVQTPPAILPAAPQPAVPHITLVAVGDIMLSRDVATAIKRHGNDPTYPFAAMRDVLRNADIAFANLETPISVGKPVPSDSITFHSDPSTVAGLVDAGIDIVSLANNHTPNAGQKGLADTFAYLHDAGIAYAGAGPDDAAASAPAIITRQRVRFAFLAYNDHDVVPASYAAGHGHAGTAIMDINRMTAAVRDARTKADVVIVSMHSGHEYTFVPDASQVAFAHAAIDAGADLVIGHHVHVVQSVEPYKGKLIFYGLGNFVFDQMWSMPTREGLMLKLTFAGASLTDVGLIPVRIDNYAQPNPADAAQAKETLARLKTDIVTTNGEASLTLPAPPSAAPQTP